MRLRLGRAWLVACLTLASVALVAAQPPGAPRHLLWKVTSPEGREGWLLGSIHVLAKSFYPLGAAIDRAFAASRTLVTEVDLDEMNDPATMLSLVGKAMLPEGQTLDRVVSKDTYLAVQTRAAAHGVPMALLQRMKPWMVAVTITAAEITKAGFDPSLGIDKHFFERAKTAGMPRRALETAAYQFDRLDGLGGTLQESSLKAMLADAEAQTTNISALAKAWRSGDALTVERLMMEGFAESPEVAERLLFERNRNWVAPIERCLSEDARCFVVVGAAHLVGRDSVVDLLRGRGHTVVQH